MKKVKKIIGILLIVIVIFGAAFGFLFLKTDLLDFLKKPKKLFYSYLEQNAKEFEELGFSDIAEKVKNNSWEENGEVTWTINAKNADMETKMALDVINNMKLGYNAKRNSEENKIALKMDVNYDGESLATLESIITKEIFGLKVNQIYEKYIVIKNENLKELAKNMGIDNTTIPDKIDESYYSYDNSFDEEKTKEMKSKYLKAIDEAISEDNYIKSDETININEKEAKVKTYTLKLSSEDLAKIINNVLNEMQNDDVLLDYMVDSINKANEQAYDNQYQKTSRAEIKIILKYYAAAIEEYKEELGNLCITVYEKNGKTLRTKINSAETELVLDKNTDNKNTNLKFTLSEENEKVLTGNIEIIKEKDSEEIIVSVEVEDTKIKYALKINKDKTETETTLYVEIPDGTAEIKDISKIEYKEVEIDEKSVINNSEILNNKTPEELNELFNKIQEKIGQLAEKFER